MSNEEIDAQIAEETQKLRGKVNGAITDLVTLLTENHPENIARAETRGNTSYDPFDF